MNFEDRVLNVNETSFEEIALSIFQYQANHNPVYAEYLKNLAIEPSGIHSVETIPHLPVEVFKYREVKSGLWEPQTYFESSGTTKLSLAKHYVRSLKWYHTIAKRCFEFHLGKLDNFVFLALLPGYLENQHSSLVNMVQFFMEESGSPIKDAFVINEFQRLKDMLETDWKHKTPVLIGVRFALLDFADQFPGAYKDVIVIETGGMKGRRREMSNEEFFSNMHSKLTGIKLASEYGMTEMTSQAYSLGRDQFKATDFVKFSIMHPTIPGVVLKPGQRGLIRITDLANFNTCSFIQTSDVGILSRDGTLSVLGRFNTSESRGCAMLYEHS